MARLCPGIFSWQRTSALPKVLPLFGTAGIQQLVGAVERCNFLSQSEIALKSPAHFDLPVVPAEALAATAWLFKMSCSVQLPLLRVTVAPWSSSQDALCLPASESHGPF